MEMHMPGLMIGQVARSAGVLIDTIRYYEREGLLDRPARSASGYRRYPAEVIARLRFISQAKDLGFSLGEIKELLSLRVTPGKSCSDVKARADAKIADVERRIAQLSRIKRALAKLSTACPGQGPTSECPILEAIDAREAIL